MAKEKFEFEGFPFYMERHNQSDDVLIFDQGDKLIGIIKTGDSKQAMTTENLSNILGDRIHNLQKILKLEKLI